MKRAPIVRHLGILYAFLGALGCGDAPPSLVAIDLVELFPLAKTRTETRSIAFGSPESRAHLIEGWGSPWRVGNLTFVWSEGDHSTLRLTIGQPRPLTLRFRCRPLRFPGAPVQTITMKVNGHAVGERELAPEVQTYEAWVPARVLVPGENRVEFRYAYHRRPSDVLTGSTDTGSRAVAWVSLGVPNSSFHGDPRATSTALPPTLILPFHSFVDYYVRVPKGSVLGFEAVAPWGDGPEDDVGARLEVSVQSARPDGRGATERSTSSVGARAGPVRLALAAEGATRISLRSVPRGAVPDGEAGLELVRPILHVPASTPNVPANRPVRGAGAAGRWKRPNIVIYLVDTLRADHLGIYGYPKPTSPHIDAFARDATVFDVAVAQASWTKPAVVSLFTGLNAQTHGVNARRAALPKSLTILPEVLRDLGYRTMAVVANSNVSPAFGFRRGFDDHEQLREPGGAEVHQLSDRVNEAAFRMLSDVPEGHPFFLYLHTTDPHAPYAPRPPHRERFAARIRNPRAGGMDHIRDLEKEGRPTRRVIADLMSLYDAEIAFNDESFGKLIERLKALGLYDSSLIVFLSDHGEAFHEHGSWNHGSGLFSEEVAVPLIMRFPGGWGSGRTVGEMVRQIDVMPTILDVLGERAPDPVQGRSLLPLAADHDTGGEETVAFSYLGAASRSGREVEGVIVDGMKLIRFRLPDQPGEVGLFDLNRDPDESVDLSEREPIWVGYLTAELDGIAYSSDSEASPAEATIDDDLRRRLQDLGYLP
jgi:arylsulfatase A-like enzyme